MATINDPVAYFHRNYNNDLPETFPHIDIVKRAATAGLPLITYLAPSLSKPLALGLGSLRSVSSLFELVSAAEADDTPGAAYAAVNTVIAITSVVSTVLAHPLGMIVTTGHDIGIEIYKIATKDGLTLENSLNILNNVLYLAMLVDGGMKLILLSFAMQIIQGMFSAHAEYQKGHWIEAAGQVALSCVRGYQAKELVSPAVNCLLPAPQFSDEELMKLAQESGNQELVDILTKYHNQGTYEPALYNAVDKGDWASARILIDNLARVEYGNPPILKIAFKHANVPADVVQKMCLHGAQVDFPEDRYSPLVLAIEWGRIDLMRVLLEQGADANQLFFFEPTYERRPLFYVLCQEMSAKRKLEAVKLLLQHGANPDQLKTFYYATNMAINGEYPVSKSHLSLWQKIVRLMLKHGANMDQSVGGDESFSTAYKLAKHQRKNLPSLWKIFQHFRNQGKNA